jgi:hypothetical protein
MGILVALISICRGSAPSDANAAKAAPKASN